jgi:hypothetical protein
MFLQNDHRSGKGEEVGTALGVGLVVAGGEEGGSAVGDVVGDAVPDAAGVGEGTLVGTDRSSFTGSSNHRASTIRTTPTTNRAASAHSQRPDGLTSSHPRTGDPPHPTFLRLGMTAT